MIDDEYISFTMNPALVRNGKRYYKALLVTVQRLETGFRVITVLRITKTTLRQLETSGCYWMERVPDPILQAIEEFWEDQIQRAMKRIAEKYQPEELMRRPSKGIM